MTVYLTVRHWKFFWRNYFTLSYANRSTYTYIRKFYTSSFRCFTLCNFQKNWASFLWFYFGKEQNGQKLLKMLSACLLKKVLVTRTPISFFDMILVKLQLIGCVPKFRLLIGSQNHTEASDTLTQKPVVELFWVHPVQV